MDGTLYSGSEANRVADRRACQGRRGSGLSGDLPHAYNFVSAPRQLLSDVNVLVVVSEWLSNQ